MRTAHKLWILSGKSQHADACHGIHRCQKEFYGKILSGQRFTHPVAFASNPRASFTHMKRCFFSALERRTAVPILPENRICNTIDRSTCRSSFCYYLTRFTHINEYNPPTRSNLFSAGKGTRERKEKEKERERERERGRKTTDPLEIYVELAIANKDFSLWTPSDRPKRKKWNDYSVCTQISIQRRWFYTASHYLPSPHPIGESTPIKFGHVSTREKVAM